MFGKLGFETLMRAVCAGHGYCGSLQDGQFVHVTDFIPKRGTVSAEDFVDWLFLADGEAYIGRVNAMRRRETLRSMFIAHMGSTTVQASRLRWQR